MPARSAYATLRRAAPSLGISNNLAQAHGPQTQINRQTPTPDGGVRPTRQSPGCIICKHLCAGWRLGYWAVQPDEDGPAQAWCEECDVALDRDRGWSDQALALADFTIYCTVCYTKSLKRHKLRGWSAGGPAPEGPPPRSLSRCPDKKKSASRR